MPRLWRFHGARLCELQPAGISKRHRQLQTSLTCEAAAGHRPALRIQTRLHRRSRFLAPGCNTFCFDIPNGDVKTGAAKLEVAICDLKLSGKNL